MPRFIIIEVRHDVYSCTIEARDLKHAQELYDKDPEEVFGDQWEQDGGNGVDLEMIVELDQHGQNKVFHTFENGELQSSQNALPHKTTEAT